MSAPDMWCGNCGAHFARCSCGVSAREVFTEEPTFAQHDAICTKRYPSSKAMRSEKEWQAFVKRYVEDINADCIKSGVAMREPPISLIREGAARLQELSNACLDVHTRAGRAVPFGIIQTISNEPICVFITDAGIELVTATGKTATLERKAATQLAKTLQDAATFRKASDI